MPITASAKKRVSQTAQRNVRNAARKNALKTAIKKVVLALASSDIENAKLFLKDAESKIARAKGKGVLHRNTASRMIGRLAQKVAQAAR